MKNRAEKLHKCIARTLLVLLISLVLATDGFTGSSNDDEYVIKTVCKTVTLPPQPGPKTIMSGMRIVKCKEVKIKKKKGKKK